jgi:hypothetical protein
MERVTPPAELDRCAREATVAARPAFDGGADFDRGDEFDVSLPA